MTYRIVQWTTGNVGRKSVHAIAENSQLELVGCYAWSPDKVGKEVGELCGITPLGVTATDDVDALLALAPDCVVYNPMFADVDEMVRILGAGINVVTTSEFINGTLLGEGRSRVAEACERGTATIFGSGINPGFIQLFAIVTAGISDRVDRISIVESFDTTIYNSPAIPSTILISKPSPRRVRASSGKRYFSSPTHSVPTSTRCAATPSTRRPPRLCHYPVTGPSRRDALRVSTCAGRGCSAAERSSRFVACGPRVRRWSPSGRRPSGTRSPSRAGRPSRAL